MSSFGGPAHEEAWKKEVKSQVEKIDQQVEKVLARWNYLNANKFEMYLTGQDV
jgi:hypothetical protein